MADYLVSVAHEASFPLIEEVEALVDRLNTRDVLIIDDARMYFEGRFQNGDCPVFARRWHQRGTLVNALERTATTHERLLLENDEGYLLLVPKALAVDVRSWLLPLPHDQGALAAGSGVPTRLPGSRSESQETQAAFIELTPQALLDVSVEALRAGRMAQARAGFEALCSNPVLRSEALHLLGVLSGVEGNHAGAVALIGDAIKLDRSRPEYFANLATALQRCGETAAARTARNDLGVALHVAGRHRDAVSVFEAILREAPNHLPTLVDIAASLQELGEYRHALQSALRVLLLHLELEPRLARVLETLREHFREDLDAALPAVDSHVPVTGDEIPLLLPKALNNGGNALVRIGEIDLAEECYAIALALAPDEAIVRWNHSHLRLLRGDFKRGFALFESRWQWSGFNFPERSLPRPRWNGESPAGKRLLVYAEQGFGDTIQFARLVPALAARGARVWFEVQQELFWIMKAAMHGTSGVEVIPRMADPRSVYGDPPYDAHCAVMSLARHLGISMADLPGKMPYLAADAQAVDRWAVFLGTRGRPRVGLVWAGRPDHARDRERSLALAQLQPLLEVTGIEWISLQLGAPRLQIAEFESQLRDLGSEVRDFGDSAGLIENLDLVITVDTAIAHLAGAMGKPVWILLPRMPDWRWLLERDDSPWYPSARLFRQRASDDWASVVRNVQAELISRFGFPSPAPASTGRDAQADHPPRACKVCGGKSELLGTVDFAKHCLDPGGVRTQRSGLNVPYFRCGDCGLTFTATFDRWDRARFEREIYNDDYLLVDPDYAEARPRGNSRLIASLVGDRTIRMLDYGGGNARFAQLMRADGFDCISWDPLHAPTRPSEVRGPYDLVTAFEVFEHSPNPLQSFAEAAELLKPDGALIFSTLVVNPEDAEGIDHWYIAPRNGHLTIYSTGALAKIADRLGLSLRHLSHDLHVAWHQKPPWLFVGESPSPTVSTGGRAK